jgi:ATP-dependent DNA helicase 2 subunit 2
VEVLRPKEVFNPVLQHFRQCVHVRALQPGAPLPGLDPLIER